MELAPRGPIYNGEGDTADLPTNYDRDMAAWRGAAYEEALRTKALSPENDRVPTYMRYIAGQQQSGRTPRYRSQFYINKTGRARQDNLALLTDSRPAIEVSQSCIEYEEQAKIIDNTLRYEWLNADMDLSLVTAVDIAQITGTAFWKIGAASPGMMRITPCSFDCVMPIQPGFHIQDSTAVLYRTWKPLQYIQRKFPERSKGIESEATNKAYVQGASTLVRPEHIDQWTWNGMAPQMQRVVGRRVSTDDVGHSQLFKTIEVHEYYVDDQSVNQSTRNVLMRDPYLPLDSHNWWYWVKPGERLYPRKRLIVFAGRRVVYDGPSPYWHGEYPFACLRLNSQFSSFWGLSKYRDLIPVNSAINEIVAGILDTTRKALNPTVIAKNTVPAATFRDFLPDLPGAKLYLTHMSANPATDVQFTQPPQLPGYVYQALDRLLQEFDKMAGIMDVAALSRKNQAPGGDTIEQMRDSLQTGLRLEGRFIETFLRDSGRQAISNIFQFYTMKRRLKILGPDGISWADFDFDPGMLTPANSNRYDHWRNFSVQVVPGSVHGGAHDRSKLMAISLRRQGDFSRKELFRRLDVPNGSQIENELKQEREELAALGANPGALAGGEQLSLSRGQRNGSPA